MYDLCRDKLYSLQRDVEMLEDHHIYLSVYKSQVPCHWVCLIDEVLNRLIPRNEAKSRTMQSLNDVSRPSTVKRPEYLIKCEKDICQLQDLFYDLRKVITSPFVKIEPSR